MRTNTKIRKNQQGVTILESIIGIALVSMIVLSLYTALFNATRLMADAKQKVGAVALATEKMEKIRNLDYEMIGFAEYPPIVAESNLIQEEIVEKNDFPYLVKTAIEYIDDPFDGEGTDDDVPNDYKQVRIEVVWMTAGEERSVVFVSDFVPDGLESDVGGGVLSINVATPDVDPIADVRVDIDSVTETNPIHGYSMTDAEGNVRIIGLPEQDYRITVSKSGYETVRTYPNPPESAFTPVDQDIYVSGLVTWTFFIDKNADLKIRTTDWSSGDGIADIDVDVLGGRLIGTDPDTYSLESSDTTDSVGEIDYDDINPGTYTISNLDSLETVDYKYVGSEQAFPIELNPEDALEVDLLFAEKSTHSLLVTVVDDVTDEPILDATVEVTGASFLQNSSTSADGKVFFPLVEDPPVEMSAEDYQVEVQASGYQTETVTASVNELTEQVIRLTSE